jgi:hypothetical protein
MPVELTVTITTFAIIPYVVKYNNIIYVPEKEPI